MKRFDFFYYILLVLPVAFLFYVLGYDNGYNAYKEEIYYLTKPESVAFLQMANSGILEELDYLRNREIFSSDTLDITETVIRELYRQERELNGR